MILRINYLSLQKKIIAFLFLIVFVFIHVSGQKIRRYINFCSIERFSGINRVKRFTAENEQVEVAFFGLLIFEAGGKR